MIARTRTAAIASSAVAAVAVGVALMLPAHSGTPAASHFGHAGTVTAGLSRRGHSGSTATNFELDGAARHVRAAVVLACRVVRPGFPIAVVLAAPGSRHAERIAQCRPAGPVAARRPVDRHVHADRQFLVVMAGVTVVELIAGKPLNSLLTGTGGSGTSVSHIFGGRDATPAPATSRTAPRHVAPADQHADADRLVAGSVIIGRADADAHPVVIVASADADSGVVDWRVGTARIVRRTESGRDPEPGALA